MPHRLGSTLLALLLASACGQTTIPEGDPGHPTDPADGASDEATAGPDASTRESTADAGALESALDAGPSESLPDAGDLEPPPPEPDAGVTEPPPPEPDAGLVTEPPPPDPDAGTPPPPLCVPEQRATSETVGRCEGLKEAYSARVINVGFFPYRVKAPIEQYSGDFSGNPASTFTPGAASKGVLLQVIPAGAYVGVNTSGPWYDPPTGCFPSGFACGSPSRAACGSGAMPQRPALAGFVWAYGYGSGASAMQGWIPFDLNRLEFAGFDPNHPCALGPAGCDFEVAEVCGKPTSCRLTHDFCDPAHPEKGRSYCGECITQNRTCGHANPCSEGADDCGETSCGAQSGGALTPSAHHLTVTFPSTAHTCLRHPPDPRVKCLANGGDPDFFFIYPFGAYLYWAQNSTTKHWLHYGDRVQAYFHNRDAQGVLWDFVEVIDSGAPVLTPKSDGTGAGGSCSASNPQACTPCRNGGTCGWIQDVFLR